MEAGSLDTQHFRIPSIFWKNLMGRGSLGSYFTVLLVAVSYRWQYVYSRWTDVFWNGCLDNQKLNIKLLYYVQLKGQRFNALSWGRLGKDQPSMHCHGEDWVLVKNQLRLFALICSALLIYVSNFLIVLITVAIQCLNIVFCDFGNIIFLFQNCFGFSISFAFPYFRISLYMSSKRCCWDLC